MSDADSGPIDGPFPCGFWMRLGFPLRSKSNFRRHQAGQTTGSWPQFRAFERSVAAAGLQARPARWQASDPGMALSARPVVVCAIAARSQLDPANFPKSVLDSLQGVLYCSDAEVAALACVGVRSRPAQDAVLCFAQLEPGSGADRAAVVAGLLLPQALELL